MKITLRNNYKNQFIEITPVLAFSWILKTPIIYISWIFWTITIKLK